MNPAAKNLSSKSLEGEVWLPIDGYEGRYDVSSLARVRSLVKGNSRAGGVVKRKIPLIRKQKINTSGYYEVRLISSEKDETLRVHRIVGIAFIPNPDNLPEINHLKGKLDNRPTSIEWSSSSNNQKHAYKNGFRVPLGGEKNPKCRLSEKQVLEIFNSNETRIELSEKYNISIYTISHIRRGSTWSYLTGKIYKRKCEQP
jgi:hypothetical protein